jgi:hypothetical protein
MLKIAFQIFAGFIVLIGIITFPLPIPIGAVLIVIGLAMLISSSKKVRNSIRSYRKRNPRINSIIMKAETYLPISVQTTINQTDPASEVDRPEPEQHIGPKQP